MNLPTNPESADTERMIQLIEAELAATSEKLVEKQKGDTKQKVHPLLEEVEAKAQRAQIMKREVREVLGELSFDVMDPSGNTTCLIAVTEEQLARERDCLVSKATQLVEKGCIEQAGFYIETPHQDEEVDAKLEMAGGEFCLNATLSLASLLQSRAAKKFNRPLLIQCSGNPEPVRCTCVFVENNTPHVTAIFSADPAIENVEGEAGILVRLPGITHFLQEVSNPEAQDEDNGQESLLNLVGRHPQVFAGDKAVGFIRYATDNQGLVIWPTILVRSTGTIVSESACGSGTAALTFFQAKKAREEGTDDNMWQVGQPSDKWMTAQFKPKKDSYPSAAVALQTDVSRICGSQD